MGAEHENRTFGKLLKKLRIEEAKIGLRAFASMINMKPSNLSNIETGRIAPPASSEAIKTICDSLGLSSNDPHREKLFDLAAKSKNRIPADVADAVKKQRGIPVLVRTVANKQLSEKKLRELAEYIKKFY
ncbi:MAG: helix-turn-helix domain-containing protein [Sedimentisphaerales bacterium]|nr:helix-turn-helix domain-containing protein [Sedimentisphaerales bacterium]